MKLSDEEKKLILESFIEIFLRISDREYQNRVWVNGEGPEVDDFGETVCYFFESCDSIIEDYKEFKITEEQRNLLDKFRYLFDAFVNKSYGMYPDELIAHPEWIKITEMAKEVLKTFNGCVA